MNNPKLYCMVGLSASGKSTIAKEIAKENDCEIVSSDSIRSEICEGGITDQSKNVEVFKIFHSRIKNGLKAGKNVIADATNITMKSRRTLLENVKKIPCYKIAYVVPKPVEQCMKDNNCREYSVPNHVIHKQLMSFQIPFIEEGFDDIVIHKFSNGYKNYLFLADCYKRMNGFDQKNPHHSMALGEHCQFTSDKFKELREYVNAQYLIGARLHDIGKLFTQKIDENGIAHYFQHENVGCYYLLSNIENIKQSIEFSTEEILNTLFLVNYHMMPMNWNSEKAKRKWLERFGEYKYQLLLDFNQCDKMRR